MIAKNTGYSLGTHRGNPTDSLEHIPSSGPQPSRKRVPSAASPEQSHTAIIQEHPIHGGSLVPAKGGTQKMTTPGYHAEGRMALQRHHHLRRIIVMQQASTGNTGGES